MFSRTTHTRWPLYAIKTIEMDKNIKDELIGDYENIIKSNHEILHMLGLSYNDITLKYRAEFKDLLLDIQNKTDDVEYAKDVLLNYQIIMEDMVSLLKSVFKAMENTSKIQDSINRKNEI